MLDCNIVIFNEIVKDRFSGFNRIGLVSELPIWGNFFVKDVFEITGISRYPHSVITVVESKDLGKLLELLQRHDTGDNIIVGRMGNLTVLDWSSLISKLKPARGIIKVQVGKIPSDLYYVKKKYLINILKDFISNAGKGTVEKGFDYFPQFLFDDALFYNFERIADIPGFSFFIRDSYEYYKENLRVVKYMRNNNFIRLYERLRAKSSSNITVGQGAVIINSLLGNGASVLGRVEDSVIFNDVVISSDTVVKNSVILPLNVIEDGVKIVNSLVLGVDPRVIEKDSKIGIDRLFKNIQDPSHMSFSEVPGSEVSKSEVSRDELVIVTEGVRISEGSRIKPGDFVRNEVDSVLS
jgi:NDP-sugar pyrophosphorylase family protein